MIHLGRRRALPPTSTGSCSSARSSCSRSSDAVPGRKTDLWIQADQPGTYKGQCFEFCGTGHADMLITLVVHTPDDYASWTKSALAEANRLNDPATAKGRETFLSLPCTGCHT